VTPKCDLCGSERYWLITNPPDGPEGPITACLEIPRWVKEGWHSPNFPTAEAEVLFWNSVANLRGRAFPTRPAPQSNRAPTYSSVGRPSLFKNVKDRVRIETVAEKLTELRPAGSALKGRCPFHVERTASFVVWPKTQRWRCFGACATGGDVIELQRYAMERGIIR